jgi:hypothetical protein
MFDFAALIANLPKHNPKTSEVRILAQKCNDLSVYYDVIMPSELEAKRAILEAGDKWATKGGLTRIVDDHTLMLYDRNRNPISFYYIDLFPEVEHV